MRRFAAPLPQLTVLFVLLGATPGVSAMGEGGMVFLLPATVYLGAVPVSGLIRAWRWRAGRTSPVPS